MKNTLNWIKTIALMILVGTVSTHFRFTTIEGMLFGLSMGILIPVWEVSNES